MGKTMGKALILIINGIGFLCFVWYGCLYLSHNFEILHPNAMLMMKNREIGGLALTVGVIPMLIANLLAFLCIGSKSTRYYLRILFFIPTLLCFILAGHFWLSPISADKPAAASEPVVKVRIESEDRTYIHYAMIYDDGRMEILENGFLPDSVDTLTCDGMCFASEIIDNRIKNTLLKAELYDENNKLVPADQEMDTILKMVASQTDHTIWQVQIFKDGLKYFVLVKLNVNWQDPCCFYRYDAEQGSLIKLYHWDGVDVTAIALP